MITGYRVRYGTTTYQHQENDEAFPLQFRHQLEAAAGTRRPASTGTDEFDPDVPDSSYYFLTQVLHHGQQPDRIDYITHDSGPRRIVL